MRPEIGERIQGIKQVTPIFESLESLYVRGRDKRSDIPAALSQHDPNPFRPDAFDEVRELPPSFAGGHDFSQDRSLYRPGTQGDSACLPHKDAKVQARQDAPGIVRMEAGPRLTDDQPENLLDRVVLPVKGDEIVVARARGIRRNVHGRPQHIVRGNRIREASDLEVHGLFPSARDGIAGHAPWHPTTVALWRATGETSEDPEAVISPP